MQTCVGDSCCMYFRGFCRDFPGRFSGHFFPHKNEGKKSGYKKKLRRLKKSKSVRTNSAAQEWKSAKDPFYQKKKKALIAIPKKQSRFWTISPSCPNPTIPLHTAKFIFIVISESLKFVMTSPPLGAKCCVPSLSQTTWTKILDGQNRQSPIAFVQRTQSTLASHSAVPRGTNVKRMNSYRAIRIAAPRTQGLWGLISVLEGNMTANER